MTGGSLWPLALADPVGVSVAFHACDTGGSRGAFSAQAAHDLRSFPQGKRGLARHISWSRLAVSCEYQGRLPFTSPAGTPVCSLHAA